MQNDLQAFNVRLPSELHAEIKRIAEVEKRSMNCEIIARLEQYSEGNQACVAYTKLNRLLFDRIVFLEHQIELMQAELEAYK
jgi:hypothetical protein